MSDTIVTGKLSNSLFRSRRNVSQQVNVGLDDTLFGNKSFGLFVLSALFVQGNLVGDAWKAVI